MCYRKSFVAACSLLGLTLVSCGGTASVPKTPDYSTIVGNWHLTGQSSAWSSTDPDPYLGAAITENAGSLYAHFIASVHCTQGNGGFSSTGNAALDMTGKIASDGTFALSNASSGALLPSVQLTVNGVIPSAGSSGWQGSYELKMSPASSLCTYNGGGSFTATAYPQFIGTYAGTIQNSGLGSSVSISLKVTQLAPAITLVEPAATPEVNLPVSAAVTVSGSSCFTSGTNQSVMGGGVAGDSFNMLLQMDDGSTMSISGSFADATEAALQPAGIRIQGGKCAGAVASATLARQP